MIEPTDILSTALSILEIACEFVTLMLPWMILAAVSNVRKAVENASNNRRQEIKVVIEGLNRIHEDLLVLSGRENEIPPQ